MGGATGSGAAVVVGVAGTGAVACVTGAALGEDADGDADAAVDELLAGGTTVVLS